MTSELCTGGSTQSGWSNVCLGLERERQRERERNAQHHWKRLIERRIPVPPTVWRHIGHEQRKAARFYIAVSTYQILLHLLTLQHVCTCLCLCAIYAWTFSSRCARISMLFCELKSYEGAIDVMEVLLRACYAGLQFHGIRNLVATQSTNEQEIEWGRLKIVFVYIINSDIN